MIGGGVVGRRIGRFLADRPAGIINSREPRELDHLKEGDVVVIASGGRHAPVAAEVITRRASVVTVGHDLDDCRQLLELEDQARTAGVSLVVGAALSPDCRGSS